ncbi:hypothetical protein [Priestia sp. YIM B13491]|uniref:hypothetical protein n=1 Tax=Priestia sp. YIM B13491 TaxID=3366312 RepID=UPI00366E469F
METIRKLKDLKEYQEQYIAESERYGQSKVRYTQMVNSTTFYLSEEFNYEGRKLLLTELKSSGCVSQNQIKTLEELHEGIYEDYSDNFNEDVSKLAVFNFCNLVQQVLEGFDNETKLMRFVTLKEKFKKK